MKSLYRLGNIVAILCVLLVAVSGCNKDEGESAQARTERLLKSATWKLSRVLVDGIDRTDLYAGMTLTVGAGTYAVQQGDPVWPASGTWKLIDDKTIDRDNGVTVKIEKLEESGLTLSLVWTQNTYGPGRARSISGSHVFEMIR